jgi:hypothetical protein
MPTMKLATVALTLALSSAAPVLAQETPGPVQSRLERVGAIERHGRAVRGHLRRERCCDRIERRAGRVELRLERRSERIEGRSERRAPSGVRQA